MLNSTLRRFGVLAAICAPLMFVACDEDDAPIVSTEGDDSIDNIIGDAGQFSQLEDLLDDTDLDDVLRDNDRSFTLFAPNNSAVTAAQSAIDGLDDDGKRNVLLYHVLQDQELTSAMINDGVTVLPNQFAGPNGNVGIFVNKTASGVKINNANLVTADLDARNGVIHEIDQVILPPSIVNIAQYLPQFTSLVDRLTQAELVGALSGDGPFTVFAPDNNAFAMTPTNGLSDARLAEILQLHVVQGNVLAGSLTDGMTVTTLNGQDITININGSTVTVTGPNGIARTVTSTDVQGTNGVVHTINGVILD